MLGFSGTAVLVHNPETGALTRSVEVAWPVGDGPLSHASVSESGRLLYVAEFGLTLLGSEGRWPGTEVCAVDLDTGEFERAEGLRAVVNAWLAWGESLIMSTEDCNYTGT